MKQNNFVLSALPTCPVCSSGRRKTIFSVRSSSVKKCQDCGLTYLDPCLSPASMKEAYESEVSLAQFQTHHAGYYSYGDLDKLSDTLTEFSKGLSLAESVLPSSAPHSIFDVGFGNGLFLAFAQKHGWKVDGIDSSSTNVALAQQRFGLSLRQGGFESFDAPSQAYDVVSFLDVVEHLPEPHAALQKAGRMLKPGGALLIAVPNDQSLLPLLIKSVGKMSFGLLAPGVNKLYFLEHVSYYTLGTLKKLLERNGFACKGHFFSSTDLDKYSLPAVERLLASIILFLGKRTGLQNRLVAVFQK